MSPAPLPNVTGRGSIEWAQVCADHEKNLKNFCLSLRNQGIKAYHDGDGCGWYEREKGKLRLQYPFFRSRNLQVGDKVAVSIDHKWGVRIHTITALDSNDPDVVYFQSEPIFNVDQGTISPSAFLLILAAATFAVVSAAKIFE